MLTNKPVLTIRPLGLLALIAVLCVPMAASAATIALVNLDGPGEGFNDTTPFAALGGNSATTLGQARLNAFQHAANIVGGTVTSGVTIRVGINMDPMGGSSNSATLGGAGPTAVIRDFSGAPVAGTWYVEALANKLANGDLSPATNDIGATFNSDVDNGTVLGATNWYYGLDGNAGGHIDFVTVVLHELVHGLGFLDLVDLATGAKLQGLDDAYMRHLEHHGASPPAYPSMTNTQRVVASTSSPNLQWTGAAVTAASGSFSAGVSGGKAQMYGPNRHEPGSSVSHFDTALSPNELMEPAYTKPTHTLGLAAQLLIDIGWSGTTTSTPSACPTAPGSLPLPTGPTPFSCTNGSATMCASSSPATSQPLNTVSADNGIALQLSYAPFAAPVDIYVLVQSQSGQLFIINSSMQWLSFPENIVPYRASSASAVNLDLLPLAGSLAGAPIAYTVVVPAGTNPATFNLTSSPYYLWCRTGL
jgi:hypothetical protein